MMNTDIHTSAQESRKPEIIWQELVDQRLDMTEVNESWLGPYKKKYNLK
jgi:hypothetical protein